MENPGWPGPCGEPPSMDDLPPGDMVTQSRSSLPSRVHQHTDEGYY